MLLYLYKFFKRYYIHFGIFYLVQYIVMSIV